MQIINLSNNHMTTLLMEGVLNLAYRTGLKLGETLKVQAKGISSRCNCEMKKVGPGKVKIERTYDE